MSAAVAPTSGGVALGGVCGPVHGACGDDGYCAFGAEDPCGERTGAGVCTARPRGCTRDCPRVCTCDGGSACNACVAHTRGQSVRHRGRCEAPVEEGEGPCEPGAPECEASDSCEDEAGQIIPCAP